jgi:formamidopyrimidine-DNA glycosylase
MPELPEVENVVRSLTPLVVGRTLSSVRTGTHDVAEPRGFDLSTHLQYRQINRIHRRAKRIVFTLDSGDRFYIHLGMTGQLLVEPYNTPAKPHTHLRFILDDTRELRFIDPRRFGGFFWMGQSLDAERDLGPEPFDLSPEQFHARLLTTRRVIKTALLDQSLVAGLGNIYVDESLFAAGIHPKKIARRVTLQQSARLLESVVSILNSAIHSGGSSLRDYLDANGNPGLFQLQHRVYDRDGEPCTTCGLPIKRVVLHQRSTHFCSGCQKR